MMGHDAPDSDGGSAREASLYGEPWEIGLKGLIKVDSVLFRQLERGGNREELGDGTGRVDGFRFGRDPVTHIGITKTLSPDDLLVIHNGDAQSLNVVPLHLLLNERGDRVLGPFVRGPWYSCLWA